MKLKYNYVISYYFITDYASVSRISYYKWMITFEDHIFECLRLFVPLKNNSVTNDNTNFYFLNKNPPFTLLV